MRRFKERHKAARSQRELQPWRVAAQQQRKRARPRALPETLPTLSVHGQETCSLPPLQSMAQPGGSHQGPPSNWIERMGLLGPRGRQRRAELGWTQHDARHARVTPELLCPPHRCGVHPERKAASAALLPAVCAARAEDGGERSGVACPPRRACCLSRNRAAPGPLCSPLARRSLRPQRTVTVAWPLAPSRLSQLANETSSRAAKRPARPAGRDRLIICRILKISMPTSWSAGLTSIQRAVIFQNLLGSLGPQTPQEGFAVPSSPLSSTAGFSNPLRCSVLFSGNFKTEVLASVYYASPYSSRKYFLLTGRNKLENL